MDTICLLRPRTYDIQQACIINFPSHPPLIFNNRIPNFQKKEMEPGKINATHLFNGPSRNIVPSLTAKPTVYSLKSKV